MNSVLCQKENCAFLYKEPTNVIGRNKSKYESFPGCCNHCGGPEITTDGKCRYVETIGKTIEGNHEGINWEDRCPWCGAATVINDVGMSWCISKECSWHKK